MYTARHKDSSVLFEYDGKQDLISFAMSIPGQEAEEWIVTEPRKRVAYGRLAEWVLYQNVKAINALRKERDKLEDRQATLWSNEGDELQIAELTVEIEEIETRLKALTDHHESLWIWRFGKKELA